MTGAITLAGLAALRGGAGLVRLAVPESCLPIVAAAEPSYMTLPLPQDAAGRLAATAEEAILAAAANATVLALGPGLGRSAELECLVSRLWQRLDRPLVVDADGLNALAADRAVLPLAAGPRILTPHPGEFARLVGQKFDAPARHQAAHELASRCRAIVVLKGHRTLITDGRRAALNTTGNPGMATGGSGDVLTGLIAALWCQGLEAFAAARLGVYLHGLAGDLAAAELGEVSLVASDLVRFLPRAFRAYEKS
jgi:NAD(P)H-hydrate epimerase